MVVTTLKTRHDKPDDEPIRMTATIGGDCRGGIALTYAMSLFKNLAKFCRAVRVNPKLLVVKLPMPHRFFLFFGDISLVINFFQINISSWSF